MRRTLAAVVVIFGLAGCAGTTGSDPGTGPEPDVPAAFDERANAVAQAWRESATTGAWRTGFVPLADLAVPPRNGFPDDGSKMAFMLGQFATEAPLPDQAPASGTIRFPDGSTLSVPLITAGDAYRALGKGAPPCGAMSLAPPTAISGRPGPDQATGTMAPHTCAVLTVTGVTLGETRLRTSRGEAGVPAWLFTIAGLTEPVARVAVAPSAVQPLPTPPLPATPHIPGLVSAQHIEAIDGAKLVYHLGVGSCDYDIRPLLYETPDVVVVGGSVRRRPGVCTAILKLQRVTVTLAQPLGARPVVDAGTGMPLTVR